MMISLLAGLRAASFGLLIVPPWQAPDEPGHYEYACLLADFGFQEPTAPARQSLQKTIITSLDEERFWERLGRAIPTPLPTRFTQDPYLISQREDEPALYYLLPALILQRIPADPIHGLWYMRLWSVLLYALTMAFLWLGLGELTPDPYMRVLAMAVALLIPMPAFIGSSANNDIAGMLTATVTLWWLARTIRRGWGLWRMTLLGIFLLVSALAKKTTSFLWPGVFLTLLIVHWRELWAWLSARRPWWPAMGLALASALSIAWSWRLAGAADWVDIGSYRPAERTDGASHAGQYALYLAPAADGEPRRAIQELSYNTAQRLRGNRLCAGAWMLAEGVPAQGYLVITDGEAGTRQGFRLTRAGWQYVETCHTV
ncbi:MAG: ArnT family glycosyltransferase, partial [Anaerolineae bacterium]